MLFMKKLFTVIALLAANLLYYPLVAQKLEVEKTYEITGKAKRGALAHAEYNASDKVYRLIYVTKQNDRKAKFQNYYFDKDFNFIKMVDDEQEFEKARLKYTWFNFRGELYSVEGNYVKPNLMGTLILKKKRITHKYDWILLGYHTEVEILNKVKPKTDDGRKFFYYRHAEDDVDGSIFVLCGEKPMLKKGEDQYLMQKRFWMLKFDKDLNLVKETKLEFDHPQTVIEAKKLQETDMSDHEVQGVSVVFAPMGGAGMKKVQDPDPKNYRYVRFGNDCSVVSDVKFTSKNSYWKIDETIWNVPADEIYLFGPSAAGKDKYYNTLTSTSKFKSVQLMKIAGNKQEYQTETMLEEFEAKMQSPPSQKKTPAYKGKKFKIANYKIANSGDFFVLGQNFKPTDKGNQFTDILSFQFDKQGKLQAQYGVNLEQKNKYAKAAGCQQQLVESADGKSMYWLIFEFKGPAAWTAKPLLYPRLGKIDLASAKINDFVSYGIDKKKDYYLDPNFPMLETEKGSRLVFFGSDKSGRNIWFARVHLN